MLEKKVTLYFVYILQCGDGTLYTGITTDITRRITEHRDGIGSRYTRSRTGVHLVYSEKAINRSAALKREAQIKSWTREQKLALIESVIK